MNKEQFTAEVLAAEQSLYHVAKSILGNDEDCADAIQNAIMLAFTKLHTLKKEAYFKTWLTRILINEAYQIVRKRKEQVSWEDYMEAQPVKEAESYSDVYRAVMELEEIYRIPFVLHYIEGFSVQEISHMLTISVSAVKTRLCRSRSMIREVLKGEYGYE